MVNEIAKYFEIGTLGGFSTDLMRLFGKADTQNRLRLEQAFPEYAEAYNNLGVTFKQLGELNKSINNYQQAIKINPEYAETYNNLGNVYNSNQKIDDAILNYKKAIKLNANFPEAYSNLGNLLKEIGEVEEAKKFMKKLRSRKTT